MTERHDFQPGNGSRYDLVYVPDLGDGFFLLTWLRYGGSGGVSLRASRGSFLHISYVMEKMRLDSEADAHALVAFLVGQGAVTGQGEVWYTTAPREYDYWHTLDLGPVEMATAASTRRTRSGSPGSRSPGTPAGCTAPSARR